MAQEEINQPAKEEGIENNTLQPQSEEVAEQPRETLVQYYTRKLIEEETKREQEGQRKLEERRQREQRANEIRLQNEKIWEENRVKQICLHSAEWGEEIVQWMIHNRIDPYSQTTLTIMKNLNEWGMETCLALIAGQITIGMTTEMLMLAFGAPTNIDEKTFSKKGNNERWVYGHPRQGAVYVWVRNGRVTKIKR